MARFFYLTEDDRVLIDNRRGDQNRLGFALQLTTLRYLGTFLENPDEVPAQVLDVLAQQLSIRAPECIRDYDPVRRRAHAAEIANHFGYRNFADRTVGFRLTRWLYGLCWTGTEKPGVLFERAMDWLLTHKVILPGWGNPNISATRGHLASKYPRF